MFVALYAGCKVGGGTPGIQRSVHRDQKGTDEQISLFTSEIYVS